MNTTGKRIIQKILAIAIILIMTMADLCFLGASLVSYAVDVAETSNKNVEFKAYFLNGNESLETTATTDKKDLKIAIELGVKKDGYLSNAKVELEDNSSFKFKTDTKSDYITNIDEKSITFKQINEGEAVKVEAGIEFTSKQEFDLDYLNKISTMNLSATYVNSKNNNTQVTGKADLQINWVSPDNIKSVLSSNVLTNSVYNEDGTNKRIVQLLISSKVENNSYPVKNTNIELNIPGEPETVTVHKRTTAATNGDRNFNTDNYTYINGNLSINVQNGQDNKIAWQKNVEDVYIVTAKYAETAEVTNSKVTINSKITTYDNKVLTQNAETNIEDNKEAFVSISEIETQNEIAKGKIYVGEDKEYTTKSEVYIDYASMLQKIEIKEQEVKAIKEKEEKEISVNYKNITFNKSNISSLFGETWSISIKDQANNIKTITNETETDENGNILVECENGANALNIETSKPVNNGTLRYTITKTIVKTNYSRNEIKELTKIKDSNKVTYIKNDENTNQSESSATINLKETESKASLSVEPLTLTTSAEQELHIKAVLETNNEYRDLYKNPIIKIKLPKQINKISAECSLMYGNGLNLEKGNFSINEENGQEVITIKLTGEQKEYSNNLPTLIITAKVELDKFSTNSIENLSMTYTNENATSYVNNGEEKVSINIVSENSIILTNNIEEYNVTSLGKENDKEVALESNAAAKAATVKMQIVNNEESDISNIAILGKIANIDGRVERTSKIRTNIEGAKVYYTTVENPTNSISKTENNWTEESSKDAKYFLVVISSLENAKRINLSYDINIGEKLPYNLTGEAYYKVSYTNNMTNTKKEAESTKLILTTGKVAELKETITAKVQGAEIKTGDEVKAGEIIEYTAVISNSGKEKAENVTVTATIPENTTLIEVNPKYPGYDEKADVYTYTEKYYIEKQDKQLVKSNLSVAENQDIVLNILVKVNENLSETVTGKLQISTVDDKNNTLTEEFANKFSPSQLMLSITPIARTANAELEYGFACNYVAEVKNLTNKELKNVKITVNKNELISINGITYHSGETTEEVNSKDTFVIKSILPNDKAEIKIEASTTNKIEKVDVANISLNAEDSNGNIYRSNIISEKVIAEKLDINMTTQATSNNSDKTVKENDVVTYTAKIKNTGKIDVENINVETKFSDYLELESVKINNKDYSQYEIDSDTEDTEEYSIIKIGNLSLKVGEESTIEIKGKVSDNLPDNKSVLKVVNKFSVYQDALLLCETDENEYNIKVETEENSDNNNSDNNDGNNNNINNNNENKNDNVNNQNNNSYEISGIVWEDSNNNGSKESEEKLLEGIKVYAIDVTTNKIATNNQQEIVTNTNNEGKYTLTNLAKGKYIVAFEYNTDKYMVTTYQAEGIDSSLNSDAVKASRIVNGEEKTAAYTDSIDLTENKANIDLGLAEAKVFSLSVEKSISKIIVTNKQGSKTYNFDDTNLAKVEIAAKDLSGSNVVIEYKIKVKNTGEIAGYAKSIVDYIPSSLTFNSGLNNDWYKKGKNIYTSSLANTKIEPGETKEVTLTLTKKMTESNTGLTNNKAEIDSSYNNLGIENTAIKANNNNSSSKSVANAENSADAIIGVKTGSAVSYVALTLTIIIAICGLAYLVNKKLLLEKIEI